jgi:1-acyl-sn-glycerol-3-phosphate acyltransferase
MKLFYKINYFLFGSIFRLFYGLKVYGVDRFPKGAAIIAPNHVSNLDPPMVGVSCPEEITFLAKKELFKVPLLAWCIRHLNAYPVGDRGDDLHSIKLILHLLNEGKKIVIFPEGERTTNGQLTSIKPGIGMLALRSKAPIIPVYIHGNFEIWPIQNYLPKLWGKTTIIFGNPIDITPFLALPKKEAQEAIANKVYSSLAELRDWHNSRTN